jgi:hypothetical protein
VIFLLFVMRTRENRLNAEDRVLSALTRVTHERARASVRAFISASPRPTSRVRRRASSLPPRSSQLFNVGEKEHPSPCPKICSTMRSSSSWCPAPSTCQVRSRTRGARDITAVVARRRPRDGSKDLERARLSRRSRRSLGLFQTRRDRARNARGRRAACPNTRSAPSAREPALITPRAPPSAPHSFPTERVPDRSAPSAVIATARPKTRRLSLFSFRDLPTIASPLLPRTTRYRREESLRPPRGASGVRRPAAHAVL